MKYTGINIGPIIPTISMGRKPREIWSASYMFSFLMECIINEISKKEGVKIISPAKLKKEENPSEKEEENKHEGIGLYPDRVFIQGEFNDVQSTVDEALKTFCNLTGICRDYVNVMHVTIEGKDSNEDKESIECLNRLLDCTELCNHPVNFKARNSILELIQKKKDSPLFIHGHGKLDFPIPYLAEIATKRLEEVNQCKWSELRDKYQGKDSNNDGDEFSPPQIVDFKIDQGKDSNNDGDEDAFYQELKNNFKETYKEDFFSFYKYICIVQADGDNMGKIVSSISADKVKTVSEALLQYGKKACEKIKTYGGLSIYAGGDDLLFIAPVRGKNHTIFGLIDEIDKLYESTVDKSIEPFRPYDKEFNPLHTYLSYGLSISYYKYPLYEAFKDALSLLFDRAKNVKGKNALSWRLRKHSGSGFKGELSKSTNIYTDLKGIMDIPVEEKQIAAIAHKLKTNENLLDVLLKKYKNDNNEKELKDRLEYFYEKTMEETSKDVYTGKTRELLYKLMVTSGKEANIETILENMYGMLRTAKFIKGEGDSDE